MIKKKEDLSQDQKMIWWVAKTAFFLSEKDS